MNTTAVTVTIPCGRVDIGDGLKTVRLCPAGRVESRNGEFNMDRKAADALIADYERHGTPVPIDVDHGSLDPTAQIDRRGAVGWIESLHFDDRRGLFAMVRWTDRGRQLIRDGSFTFISPALLLRKSDRRPVSLDSAALVTRPAIGGQERLAASRSKPKDKELMKMADEPGAEGANTNEENGNGESPERLVARIIKALGIESPAGDVLGQLRQILESVREETTEAAMNARLAAFASDIEDESIDLDVLVGEMAANLGIKTEGASLYKLLPRIAEAVREVVERLEKAGSVMAAARRRLSLPDEAESDQIVLALASVSGDTSRAELEAMKEREAERIAVEAVQKHGVQTGRINPNDKEQYEAALAFARRDAERFEHFIRGLPPVIPVGKTEPPTDEQMRRCDVLMKARREFLKDPAHGRVTDVVSFAKQALRDAGEQAVLDDAEQRILVAS